MEILTATELRLRYPEILDKIKSGVIFIHPTDTIYGIGCNALDDKAVEKVRRIKEQGNKPFSIWVPSIEWIEKNCVVTSEVKEWLQRLPGPYTLVIRLKHKTAVSEKVILGDTTIGVRYPDHWFGKIITELNIPLITTSANKTGQPFMTCADDLDPYLERKIEFMIYEGEKKARPSKIINVVEGSVKER